MRTPCWWVSVTSGQLGDPTVSHAFATEDDAEAFARNHPMLTLVWAGEIEESA